jgi:phage-related protein
MVEIISDVQREKNRALDAFTQEKNFLKGQITRKEADESSDEKPTFESLEKIKKQKVSLKLTTNEEFNGKLVDVIK